MDGQPLDPRIWAAIITSIATLVIALFNLWTNKKTSSEVSLQARELEKLKSELAKQLEKEKIDFQKVIDKNKLTLKLQTDEIKDNLNALHIAIRDFQKVKAELKIISETSLEDFEIDRVAERFSSVNDDFQKSYQSSISHLDKYEKDIFHNAKDIALKVNRNLIRLQKNKTSGNRVSLDFYESVRKTREYFSEMQNLLRDRRFEKTNSTT